jgi:hypothetical protein
MMLGTYSPEEAHEAALKSEQKMPSYGAIDIR